jgi:hypothetical protein
MKNFAQLQCYSLPGNGQNGKATIVGNVRHEADFIAMPFGRTMIK